MARRGSRSAVPPRCHGPGLDRDAGPRCPQENLLWGRAGQFGLDPGRRCLPAVVQGRRLALGWEAVSTRTLKEKSFHFYEWVPGFLPPPSPTSRNAWKSRDRSYFYTNLSELVVCVSLVFPPTPGKRRWSLPWVAAGWFVCCRRGRRRAETRGIGRLTSDIGLRPNASCPAASAGLTVAAVAAACWLLSPNSKRWDWEQEWNNPLHCTTRCPERSPALELVQGSFSPLKTVFGKLRRSPS